MHRTTTLLTRLNNLAVVDGTKEYELIHTLMACYGNKPDPTVLELVNLLERVLDRHDKLYAMNQELEESNRQLREKLAQNEFSSGNISPRKFHISPVQRLERDQFILNQIQASRELHTQSPYSTPTDIQTSPFSSPRDIHSSPYSSPRDPFSPRTSPFASPRPSSYDEKSLSRRTSGGLSSSKILNVNSSRSSLNSDLMHPASPSRKSEGTSRTSSRHVIDLNEQNSTRSRGQSEPINYSPLSAPLHKQRTEACESPFISSQRWDSKRVF